ncbi:methyltransferase domain-containing protein [Streptomyces roseirectus]|uniref:Methyltransferase domain-containing protein n=1 Tax=Streptomyces roseirectus TaxID=2768066 RepID=A0A7H0IND3_9ACTN|nr:class I SAM-dependent methyltransferase [Streptomyces roseirectus]QNP74299.1 methyltransferase domain-containing protein [Streptomyces roseirectus]
MDPADFYTGIVAEIYGPLKAHSQDPEPYAEFVRAAGEPALELGCGDGDPLLDLRGRGLDVDGVDSSADMLERLRHRAGGLGVPVTVFHQRMEALDLPRRYRAVFLAGPTFTLLPDDATALAALRGIRAHLTDDGTALVPLFAPEPTPADQFGRVRTATAPDGADLRVSVVSEERDERARTQTTLLRYERHHDGGSDVVDRPWVMHWYPRAVFEELAASAGLTVAALTGPDGEPVPDDATHVHFHLRPASPSSPT